MYDYYLLICHRLSKLVDVHMHFVLLNCAWKIEH